MRSGGRPGLFREAPRFRSLWLSKSISATGTGAGRVALVLVAARSGPGAVSLALLATALPSLLSPLAGAVADRVDQRRLLAGCEAGQGLCYVAIALATPRLAVLIPLVAVASLFATLMSPAGKSTVPRLVPPDRLARANALLGLAVNLQIVAGPALGGLLAGLAGPVTAFAVNAASFALSALLLARLGPLPAAAPAVGAGARGLAAGTWAGLGYATRSPVLRALTVGTLLFVSFAAMDNVVLVFLVQHGLHLAGAAYGLASAAFGAGMVAASLFLAARADRRRPAFWLVGGVSLGALGTVATGLAPGLGAVAAAQAVAGAGNTADLVGTDTLVQRTVPAPLLGRAFGAVYGAAQLGSSIAYLAAAPLVAAAGPRVAFVLAGLGMLTGLAAFGPALRGRDPAPGPVRPGPVQPGPVQPGPVQPGRADGSG